MVFFIVKPRKKCLTSKQLLSKKIRPIICGTNIIVAQLSKFHSRCVHTMYKNMYKFALCHTYLQLMLTGYKMNRTYIPFIYVLNTHLILVG